MGGRIGSEVLWELQGLLSVPLEALRPQVPLDIDIAGRQVFPRRPDQHRPIIGFWFRGGPRESHGTKRSSHSRYCQVVSLEIRIPSPRQPPCWAGRARTEIFIKIDFCTGTRHRTLRFFWHTLHRSKKQVF